MVFTMEQKRIPDFFRITGISAGITVADFCMRFDPVLCLSLLSSFSLSWPIQTSCCPTWVRPTCPTTAAMTCCLCSRTTDRLHTRLSVPIPFLCCGPAPTVRCLLAPTICVCICLWVLAWVRVNVHECVVVYLWIVLLSFDIHQVQCAGIEGTLSVCEHVGHPYNTEPRHWLCGPAFKL